jgi:hypothetical protein
MTKTEKQVAIAVGVVVLVALLWDVADAKPAHDPGSAISFSNYVTKDGKCYLVTFYVDGTHDSQLMSDSSLCAG